MKKPPFKGGRPARPAAPAERGVYRHPDAEKASPTPPPKASPWQRSDAPRDSGERGRAGPPARERSAPGAGRPAYGGRGSTGPGRSERPAYGGARTERPVYGERRERPAPRPQPEPIAEADADGTVASEFDRDGQRRREVRIYGRAACLAVAHDRIGAIRKLYHTRERAPELGGLLARLAAARIGYREIDSEEMARVAGSQHHEGLCCDILRLPALTLAELREELEAETGPACLLALEGVSNPHNFGAILRSAVHFGARAVLIPSGSTLTMAGAVYRVAEGAAERIDVIRYDDLSQLQLPGFSLVGTALGGARQLYRDPLPARSVLLFGAEGAGLSPAALAAVSANYAIPGSGRVDSLNVAQAVAVVLGEWWRSSQT